MSYEPLPTPERPRLRPPVGIPVPKESRARSVLAAVGLHALVIALLVVPFAAPAVVRVITGDTTAVSSGGGGGGLRGTGGDRGGPPVVERLRFVQIVPPAAAPPPAITPPVVPLVVPSVPPPVAKPPVAPKSAPASPAPPASSIAAPVAGSGGGTGADGTLGSGPGTGGGVGSGVGAGQGSGTGPAVSGTGAAVSAPAPTLIETFLPPNGVAKRDKGKTIVAVFDVDSTGRVLNVEFTQVSDGGYNRKLREVFSAFRFRPAVKPDGTPIRAKTSFEYVL